jgi:4'-phosphopantetheinyl transferase
MRRDGPPKLLVDVTGVAPEALPSDEIRVWSAELRQGGRLDAWAAVRVALSSCLDRDPPSLAFRRDPGGKPRLDAEPGSDGELHFNLARSGDTCLIAATRLAPVGVDVEHVVAFPELDEIVRKRFAPEEAAAILSLEGAERLRAFYRCWTRKEACLKASGVGIGGGLDGVVVSVGEGRPSAVSRYGDDHDGWSAADVLLPDGIVGAVALQGKHELPQARLEAWDLGSGAGRGSLESRES